MNAIAPYFAILGAIFLTGAGLPLPEDFVVLGAGYLVYSGVVSLYPTVAVALVAVLAGDVFLYWAGRRWGRQIVGHPRLGVSPERLARAERFFARWGAGAIVLARFVAGLRAAVYLAAGLLRQPFGRFFAIDFAASLVNVPLLVLLGRYAGPQLDRVAAQVAGVKLAVLAIAAVALAVVWLMRRRRRAR